LPDGRDRVVRHGHGPQRTVQTGIGPVEVRRAKVRDRGDVGADEKIRFTSSILPKWARRTKSLDALLPILYLCGVSTGDFQEALCALLSKDAPNLSPAAITRLTAEWRDRLRPLAKARLLGDATLRGQTHEGRDDRGHIHRCAEAIEQNVALASPGTSRSGRPDGEGHFPPTTRSSPAPVLGWAAPRPKWPRCKCAALHRKVGSSVLHEYVRRSPE
jgi:hypothetical protein